VEIKDYPGSEKHTKTSLRHGVRMCRDRMDSLKSFEIWKGERREDTGKGILIDATKNQEVGKVDKTSI